jgi:glycosyltransferase involved in cell wall biosynthesis
VEYLQRNGFRRVNYIAPFKKENHPVSFEDINPCHFLFAGHLGAHKGIHLLLAEFALASRAYALPDWPCGQDAGQGGRRELTLTIAGTGAEETRMRTAAKQLGIEKNVFFVGWQTDLTRYYRECAAVIFPSIWLEAFGLTIIEAMGHARPVIGPNRGSPAWLIDDHKTGLIFDPLIQGDLAAKILMLAGNKERAIYFGSNGQEKLQTLIDNEKILGRIIAQYQEVAHAK